MDFGNIKKIYILHNLDKRILDKIQTNLEEKNVDEIKRKNNLISFNNNFLGKRTNLSLMSSIDSGYFNLIENDNYNKLIIGFSLKRVLIFWMIISFLVFIINSNNIIVAFIISSFLSISIFLSILRYKLFINRIVKEFQKKKNSSIELE